MFSFNAKGTLRVSGSFFFFFFSQRTHAHTTHTHTPKREMSLFPVAILALLISVASASNATCLPRAVNVETTFDLAQVLRRWRFSLILYHSQLSDSRFSREALAVADCVAASFPALGVFSVGPSLLDFPAVLFSRVFGRPSMILVRGRTELWRKSGVPGQRETFDAIAKFTGMTPSSAHSRCRDPRGPPEKPFFSSQLIAVSSLAYLAFFLRRWWWGRCIRRPLRLVRGLGP